MRSLALSAALLALTSSVTASPAMTARASCGDVENPTSFFDTDLPDPFLMLNGQRVTTKSDWECRREEISTLFQRDELGIIPPKPEKVTASFTPSTLTVNAEHEGQSISFNVSVTLPTNGTAPFPAIIALSGGSIPFPDTVAVLNFDNSAMAEQNDQSSRGVGLFFDLYGANASAGAMAAWTWGVSRIIDGLELTADENNIRLDRLAITGCSRDGKGALVAAAFEERLALTISQESGSGGAGCWRISDAMLAEGLDTQTAGEIVQENVWFSPAFDTFATNVSTLPFDHHMLVGLVAPRAAFVTDNSGILWLGQNSTFGCMQEGRKIFQALGIEDNMGFSDQGGHDHCAFPASQVPELTAFIDKFLFDQPADTNVFTSNGNGTLGFVESDWVNWQVPRLAP